MKAPIMKPKLLNPWELAQAVGTEKAHTKFFFSKFIFCNCLDGKKPFTYTGQHTREFGQDNDEMLSKRQKEILAE